MSVEGVVDMSVLWSKVLVFLDMTLLIALKIRGLQSPRRLKVGVSRGSLTALNLDFKRPFFFYSIENYIIMMIIITVICFFSP